MRISDWSSDVCSSDLARRLFRSPFAVRWVFAYRARRWAARLWSLSPDDAWLASKPARGEGIGDCDRHRFVEYQPDPYMINALIFRRSYSMSTDIAALSVRELDALLAKVKQRKAALKKRKPITAVRKRVAALHEKEDRKSVG